MSKADSAFECYTVAQLSITNAHAYWKSKGGQVITCKFNSHRPRSSDKISESKRLGLLRYCSKSVSEFAVLPDSIGSKSQWTSRGNSRGRGSSSWTKSRETEEKNS